MNCTTPSQADLETRIARLERTNGLYRKVLLLPFVGVAVLAVVGFKFEGVQDLVKAKKFVVVDDDGKERVIIGRPGGDLGKDASGVFVYDPKGTLRVCTASPQPDPPGVAGQRRDVASGLSILDATGKERGGLVTLNDGTAVCALDGKDHEGVAMAVWPNGSPTFALWNPAQKGYQRSVSLNVDLDGHPDLAFIDPDGKSRMRLGIDKDTKAGLSLRDANEKELLRFKLSGEGTPDIEPKK